MKKQTVLITGASSGIGLQFARIFAQNGYHLVLVARHMEPLDALKGEYNEVSIENIEMDLSVQGSGQQIHDTLIAKNISIDILVNNAGFGDYGLFHTLDLARQVQMIDLNIRTLTELTYLFGKDMVQRRSGKILNMASMGAFFPGPLMSVYFATKHYVLAFSEAIANEWSEYGVSVTALCPGPTESGFQDAAKAHDNSAFQKKLPTASEVAHFGYDALMSAKVVAIPGLTNVFLSSIVRLIPRSLVTRIVRKLQGKQ